MIWITLGVIHNQNVNIIDFDQNEYVKDMDQFGRNIAYYHIRNTNCCHHFERVHDLNQSGGKMVMITLAIAMAATK